MGRLFHALLTLCVLTGLQFSAVSAQQPESADAESSGTAAKPIEEISVTGQRSLARLRLRIDQKQTEIFNFFNDNNSSDRMDIICRSRRATGTNILKKECEPRFLRDLRVEKTRDQNLGIGVPFTQYDLVGLSAQDFVWLQNEMLVLMSKNKEFAKILADLVDLSENLEIETSSLFGNK